MSEFKVDDKFLRVYDGKEFTIRSLTDTHLTWENGVPRPLEEIVLPAYKRLTPKYRHGDVYEDKGGVWNYFLITKDGSVFHDDEECNLLPNVDNDSDCDYTGHNHLDHLGKLLFNIFDKEKESADSDCDNGGSPMLPEQPYDQWVNATGYNVKEDNTKEAIMPLTIIKNTSTILPSGTEKIDHMVNGQSFDTYTRTEAVALIRRTNAEIKGLQVDADDTGCESIQKDVDEQTELNAVLVKLVDAPTES